MLSEPLHPAPGRFLHLIHDEKFIDAAQAIFEEATPTAHDFLVIGGPTPLRHIRTFAPARLDLDSVLERRFLSQLPRYSAVFVHYLSEPARRVVAAAPRSARFIWLGWGADYYHLIQSRDELLLPTTRGLVSDPASRMAVWTSGKGAVFQHLVGVLRAAAHPFEAARRIRLRQTLRRIGQSSPGEAGLINRFQAVAMPIEEDYTALRAKHPEVRIAFLDWNYWTEGFCAQDAPAGPTDNNILLGNSATPANNHLEALEYLSGILPSERKIICPLNYGDERYGDVIEKAGLRLLGSRFIPLRDYMDSAAYSEVVASCSIVVMNHLRQQALGNIILALRAGAHVFLHPRNPINTAMRRIGVQVHDLNQLPDFLDQGEPAVAKAKLAELRGRLEAQYGRPSIVRRTRGMLRQFGSPHDERARAG